MNAFYGKNERSVQAQAPTPIDKYAYWRAALAGKPVQTHIDDPQCGFYRKRTSRGGPFVPVAIFEHDGKIVSLVDGRLVDADDIWTFACRYPVAEQWYRDKISGKPWPDEDAAVTGSLTHAAETNNPPTDEAETLKEQIAAAAANAADYADIRDDATAGKAQSCRARLNELGHDADKRREAEKKPHLEASRAVDAKWRPIIAAAKTAADAIARALSAHETRKARSAEEARRRAEEDRRRREDSARQAAEAGKPVSVSVAAPPPPPAPEPVPTTTIRGAYGRGAAVKIVKVATVVDQDAAYGYLKNHAELKDLIAKLAQRAVNAGYEVPGVKIEEQRKVV